MKVDTEWLKRHSTITLKCEPETDLDWRREFEGSPDTIRWMESELAAGNEWAWCSVTVIVSFQGFEHREHIGGCAYQNETEFKNGGYYEDLVGECVDEIAESFEKLADTHGLWQHEKKTCVLCIADGD